VATQYFGGEAQGFVSERARRNARSEFSRGYFIGLTIGFWADSPLLFPRWHLAIITSFCIGLAVFSLASAGSATLSHKERFIPSIGAISLHVIALFAMTALGALTFQWIDDIEANVLGHRGC